MSGDQLGEDIGELYFIVEGGDGSASRGSLPVGQQDG